MVEKDTGSLLEGKAEFSNNWGFKGKSPQLL